MAKAKPQGKVVAAAKGKGKGAGGAGGVGGSKATNKANDKKRITPKKPKARVQRLLKKREPQLVEGGKCALLMRGTRCPDELKSVLKDLVRVCVRACVQRTSGFWVGRGCADLAVGRVCGTLPALLWLWL